MLNKKIFRSFLNRTKRKTLSIAISSTIATLLIFPYSSREVLCETSFGTVSEDITSDTQPMDDASFEEFLESGGGYVKPDLSIYDFDHKSTLKKRNVRLLGDAPTEEYYVTGSTERLENGTPVLPDELKADNQYNTLLCWIYSSNKAIEFNLYKKTGKTANISEKNTAYYMWHQAGEGSENNALLNSYMDLVFDQSKSHGLTAERGSYLCLGNSIYLKNYLAAWKGMAEDKGDDHFEREEILSKDTIMNGSSMNSPLISNVYNDSIGHVQDVLTTYYYDLGVSGVKELIKEYGAVTASVSTKAFMSRNQYPTHFMTMDKSNHEIAVVGWDDNYPKERFNNAISGDKTHPDNDGAWYCINSWGYYDNQFNWKGDANGGFWLSYEDECMTNSPLSVFNTSLADTSSCYEHNYFGGSVGVEGTSSTNENFKDIVGSKLIGISYTLNGDGNTTGKEKVKAIGLNTRETNSAYSIKVYTGTGDNKLLRSAQNVSIPYVGYHTIPLASPFVANEGEVVSIEFSSIDPNEPYVGILASEPNSRKHSEAGFVSSLDPLGAYEVDFGICDGYDVVGPKFGAPYGTTRDKDLHVVEVSNLDVQLMVHLFTTDIADNPTLSTITPKNPTVTYGSTTSIPVSDYVTYTLGADNENRNHATISMVSDNTDVISVAADNSLTVNKSGTANITITTSDGVSAVSKITVTPATLTADNIKGLNSNYTRYCESEGNGPIVPNVYVTGIGNATLTKGTDYEIEYKDNDKTGTATVTVKGKGDYQGTASKQFSVLFVTTGYFTDDGTPINVKTGDTVNAVELSGFVPGTHDDGSKDTVTDVNTTNATGTMSVYETDLVKIEGNNVTFKKAGSVEINITTSDFRVHHLLNFTITGEDIKQGSDEPSEIGGGGEDTPSGESQEGQGKQTESGSETKEQGEQTEPGGEVVTPGGNDTEKEQGGGNTVTDPDSVVDNLEEKTNPQNPTDDVKPDNPSDSGENKGNSSDDEGNKDNGNGQEDNPSQPENPGNDSGDKKDDTPSGTEEQENNPVNPAPEPKVDENVMTIDAENGDYSVNVVMNKFVPFTKKKKEVVSHLDLHCSFFNKNGSTGIYVKSVKATKPKRGVSKVTIVLKGTNKDEKRALKAINKKLKKIPVTVNDV